jgi:hypothetical protein
MILVRILLMILVRILLMILVRILPMIFVGTLAMILARIVLRICYDLPTILVRILAMTKILPLILVREDP